MKLLLSFILIIVLSTKIQTQKSLFDSIDSPSQSKNTGGFSSSGKEVLSSVLSKLKNEIKTPLLKDNLTPEGIAKFISSTLSGNQFINNLQVKGNAELHHVEVLDSIKVNGKATFDSLKANKIITSSITLDDAEAVIDSNTILKLDGKEDVSFKVGDVFEAITFTKYIVSICGDKLDKCDFGMLMKNRKKKEEPKMKSVVIASPMTQEKEPKDIPMFKEKAMENEIKSRIDKEYEEYKKNMEKLNRNNNNDLSLSSNTPNIYNDPSYVNLLNSYYYSNGFLNSNMPQ